MLLVVKTVQDADRGHQSQETLTQQWVVSGAQRRQRHPRSGEHTKESSLSAPSSRHRSLCIAEFWDSVGLPYTPMCRPQSLSTINNSAYTESVCGCPASQETGAHLGQGSERLQASENQGNCAVWVPSHLSALTRNKCETPLLKTQKYKENKWSKVTEVGQACRAPAGIPAYPRCMVGRLRVGGPCSGGPCNGDEQSRNETSVSPLLLFPPTHPITTSNIIHHLVFVAARIEEQTGEINNNCGVTVRDAIRIQHGSKHKYKQTIFILLKHRSILPPSFPEELLLMELWKEMNQR